MLTLELAAVLDCRISPVEQAKVTEIAMTDNAERNKYSAVLKYMCLAVHLEVV